MKLSRSSFYYKAKAKNPERMKVEADLRGRIETICPEFPRYGYRRVTHRLKHEGRQVNHKKVLWLMRETDLPCHVKRKWVKRETVAKHFGEGSGIRGYLWGVLLESTTVGGLYVAFPGAYSLYNKGAKLSVIFTYIAASAICRVPMTIFEASFMSIKFSAIRLFVALPLVIVTLILLGSYLTKRNYKIAEGK